MNKKLIFAVGLTALMAACSSEDVLTDVQNSQDLSMFEGIEKVNAEFNWGVESRLANRFGLEKDDVIGFAWLTDGERLEQDGAAYQNHPLYAVSENGLQPKTSIYVGKYFSYAPYDESVVAIENINFSIPQSQDMLSSWNGLAKNAIYISPIWTNVERNTIDHVNEAGRNKKFTISPRKFSNAVRLNLAYIGNEIDLYDEVDKKTEASDPEIFDMTVSYLDAQGQLVSIDKFQYAPTEEPNVENWEQHILAEEVAVEPTNARSAEVELKTVQGIKKVQRAGYTLEPKGKKYFADRSKTGDIFRYNALPALTEVGEATEVLIEAVTTYGKITIKKPVNEIAYTAYEDENGNTAFHAQPDGVTTDEETKLPLEEGTYFDFNESFVQVLGKNGELKTDVDFATAIMDGMHVRDDEHLLQLLRYYRDYKLGTEYEEDMVDLYLDEDFENEFKISKTSIALMQSINAAEMKVRLNVCRQHGNPIVVVTNNAKEGKEVPEFTRVFAHTLEVYLEAQDWTWNETVAKNTGKVTTIYNRGNLTVGSTNVEVSNKNLEQIVNLEDASINFTANVATLWKVNLTNNGTINIPATAHMRVYSDVVNNVTEVTGVRTGKMGIIDNYGVFGAVEEQKGSINNFGKIYHRAGAKTFITNNEDNEDFSKTLAQGTKIGIIEMTEADANVSVSNTSDKGIITYKWSKDVPVYVSPAVVRYNYLIVEGNIEFTEKEAEIRYLEINGADVYVNNKGYLSSLQGVIVDKNNALNITEGNKLKPAKAAYLKGYVYNGGEFTYNSDVETYFGGEDADKENILKWTGF